MPSYPHPHTHRLIMRTSNFRQRGSTRSTATKTRPKATAHCCTCWQTSHATAACTSQPPSQAENQTKHSGKNIQLETKMNLLD